MKTKLSRYLRKLSRGEGTCNLNGVCGLVYKKFGPYSVEMAILKELLDDRELMGLYPHYSHSVYFPIKHNTLMGAGCAFFHRPPWVGEYGRRRKMLCLFLADVLEEKFKGSSGYV